jgi:hypothetical protein
MINKTRLFLLFIKINKYDMDIKPIIIQKIPSGFAGRKHSDVTKKKISDSKTGKPNLKNRKGDRDSAIQDRNDGLSVKDIAVKYGVTTKTVYAWLKNGSLT